MGAFLVNGHEYSFASIRASLGSLTGDMISSIKYSDGLEPGKVLGGDGIPVGMTLGLYTAEASIALHTRRHCQQWIDSFNGSFYEVYFTLTVSYSETSVSPVITDTIPLCRVKKFSIDGSNSSSDAIAVPAELAVGGVILWNGKPGVKQRQY
ncbi:MAG: hypothetical protein FWD57_06025 [Polyangiaceae bacterium]|nr:hypothetical protein [Polyangiaceae bacterium]